MAAVTIAILVPHLLQQAASQLTLEQRVPQLPQQTLLVLELLPALELPLQKLPALELPLQKLPAPQLPLLKAKLRLRVRLKLKPHNLSLS
jgi:hypothetical protein